MKTIKPILALLIVSIAMLLSMPNCLALKGEPGKAIAGTCLPPITINVTVKLLNDCDALQNCHFEILVFDQTGCTVETQPIASMDYTYGYDTFFSTLTFYEAKVKVCVRLKPGSSCVGYTYYAPKCECRDVSSSDMTFELDICNP